MEKSLFIVIASNIVFKGISPLRPVIYILFGSPVHIKIFQYELDFGRDDNRTINSITWIYSTLFFYKTTLNINKKSSS